MSTSSLDTAIERLNSSSILPNNKKLILKHDKKLKGGRISEERRKKFVDRLRWWAKAIRKDYRKATKKDLEKAYEKLKIKKYTIGKGEKKEERDMKVSTINIYLTMLKQFYKWLEGDDEEFPKKVKKLKPLPYEPDLISEDGETSIQIYKVEELEKMIKLARSPREKCLIALSYDCGGRLSEILRLDMKHIKHKPPFFKIYMHGDKTYRKHGTGKRWVSVYYSVPYIMEFLKSHPYTLEDSDMPFWVNSGKFGGEKNERLSQSGFKTLFDRVKKKAGIEGRRFHDLRHTKITHLLRLNMSEAKVKKYVGHSKNSRQLGRYAHLYEDDIDEDLYRMYGLEYTGRKHDDIPIPIKCPKCSTVNDAGSDVCKECYNPISAKAVNNATTRERYWKQKYEKKLNEKLSDLERRLIQIEEGRRGRVAKSIKSKKGKDS